MNDLKLMCKVITPYICPLCNESTLFFIINNKNGFNNLLDYKSLIDRQTTIYELKDNLSSKPINGMKCISCNKEFMLDWRTGFPIPLTDTSPLIQFGQKPKH